MLGIVNPFRKHTTSLVSLKQRDYAGMLMYRRGWREQPWHYSGTRGTVLLWRRRFQEGGMDALTHIAPGRGRRPTYTAERVNQIVEATTQTKPRGATHWSTRTMAKAQGLSKDTVQRIWSAHGLQPHRTKRYKLSKDQRFTEKLTDVVGVYLNPPDKAVVLCVDEKSQIQALQRTQPGLPMKKGRCGTMTMTTNGMGPPPSLPPSTSWMGG